MNAVERLLAQGERLLALYDEMYRERLGSGRDPALPDVPQTLLHAAGGEVFDSMPPGLSWASGHWLQAAAETAWLELQKSKKQPSSKTLAARTAELFGEYLAQREHLLSDAAWRRLLADVVAESRDWEPLSEKVVALAEKVCEAVKRVGRLDSETEPQDWLQERWSIVRLKPLRTSISPALRTDLRQGLDRLHPFAQPPRAETNSSLKQKPSPTKQPTKRSRKGIGGRPEKFTMKFIREVFAARERDKKHAAKAKRRLPAWAPWLWDFCENRINIAETFPPAFKGEPWQPRAERFKKAAKKRLREAETNRH